MREAEEARRKRVTVTLDLLGRQVSDLNELGPARKHYSLVDICRSHNVALIFYGHLPLDYVMCFVLAKHFSHHGMSNVSQICGLKFVGVPGIYSFKAMSKRQIYAGVGYLCWSHYL